MIRRQVVVLHARQAIGPGLKAAFDRSRFRVRVWTTGDPSSVFRDGIPPEGIRVEQVPDDDASLLAAMRKTPAGSEVVTNDEYRLKTGAWLRAEIGLPARHPADIDAWTDKVVMKTRLREAGVSTPDFVSLDPVVKEVAGADLIVRLGLPVVVKPRRGANNRGIAVIHTERDLDLWLSDHEAEAAWQAEAFVTGRLHHANALVVDERLFPVQVGMYTAPLLELNAGRPAGSVTLPHDHPVAAAGRRLNGQVVAALGGRGSFVVHTEFFIRPHGEMVVLEAAARAPGALVSEIAAIHSRVHLEEASFRLQIGEAPSEPAPTGMHAAWMWFPRADILRAHRSGHVTLRSEHRFEEWVTPVPAALLAWNVDFSELAQDLKVVEASAMASGRENAGALAKAR